MDKLLIEGGAPLHGEAAISGAKNAALPLLCAALLTREPLTLTHVPRLNDVDTMLGLLEQMGVKVFRETGVSGRADESTVTLDASGLDNPVAPYERVKTMRAAILVLGPLAARHDLVEAFKGGVTFGADAASAEHDRNRLKDDFQVQP